MLKNVGGHTVDDSHSGALRRDIQGQLSKSSEEIRLDDR